MSGISRVAFRRFRIQNAVYHISSRPSLSTRPPWVRYESRNSSHIASYIAQRAILRDCSRAASFDGVWSHDFHWTAALCDDKPSSKLESAVNASKEEGARSGAKAKDAKALVQPSSTDGAEGVPDVAGTPAPTTVTKTTLWQKIKHEAAHYYHGFRLLFLNTRVCRKYVMKVLKGETLSRRENQQASHYI